VTGGRSAEDVALVIIDHARRRMPERGVSEDEVREVLARGRPAEARGGRQAVELVFPYNSFWQGRFYEQKKVKIIYVEEGADQIVIIVYAYYGGWDQP
jgi:radical SAM superfamily enzyme YgiQ (UPF0313 family)